MNSSVKSVFKCIWPHTYNQNHFSSDGSYAPAVFINVYFFINFIIVLAAGVFAWFEHVPNRIVIPAVIAFYSLVLFPRILFREIVTYTTVICYPAIIILNGYDYSVAIACWYPVLINCFIVSLQRKKTWLFVTVTIYHIIGFFAIVFMLVNPLARFWYLGIITNLMSVVLLGFAYYLFLRNQELTLNQQWLLKILRHDIGNWTNQLVLGESLSRKNNQPVHKLISEGIRGLHDWAHRLKDKSRLKSFAMLETIPYLRLIGRMEKSLGGMVLLTIVPNSLLADKSICIDPGLFINCLLNLVRNAHEAQAKEISITFECETSKTCCVIIKDNGLGISEHISGRLFAGQISSSDRPGAGFGLMGVQHSLFLMNCSIQLEEPNATRKEWTIFKIKGINFIES